MDVSCWGHRGASAYAPENTLSSFRRCLEEGANIELDLRQTRDGTVVVMHDASVDRTTSGCGQLAELDWDYVRELDAGSWFSSEFEGEPVPSFATVLSLLETFPERSGLLDTKVLSPGMLAAMEVDIAASKVERDRLLFGCWNLGKIPDVVAALPGVSVAFIGTPAGDLRSYRDAGASVIHVESSRSLGEVVSGAHEEGLLVYSWVLDSEQDISRALGVGVDGMCGDYPDRLLAGAGAPVLACRVV